MIQEWHEYIQMQNLPDNNKGILIRISLFREKIKYFTVYIPVLTVKCTYIIIQVHYFVRKNFLLKISVKMKISDSVNLSPCQAGRKAVGAGGSMTETG